MTAFTIVGLIVFWLWCYHVGQFLAWCSDSGGVVIGVARVLVNMDEVRVSLHNFIHGDEMRSALHPQPQKEQQK